MIVQYFAVTTLVNAMHSAGKLMSVLLLSFVWTNAIRMFLQNLLAGGRGVESL